MDTIKLEHTFRELAAHQKLKVQGTHWASLITSYGVYQKIPAKAREVFDSIASHPSTRRFKAELPDAVCLEALVGVYAAHNQYQDMHQALHHAAQRGIHLTAYGANLFIKAYAASGSSGIEQARSIFDQMQDPPVGVAAAGNHGPRLHGAGAAQVPSRDPAFATPADPSNPWSSIFREPSTYEEMIKAELSQGHIPAAQSLLQRMHSRAFPPPIIMRAEALIQEAGSAQM